MAELWVPLIQQNLSVFALPPFFEGQLRTIWAHLEFSLEERGRDRTDCTATLTRALATSREFLTDYNATRGENKLIMKIKTQSSYFSFSKEPIFLTIPPNYRLAGFLLFPRCCCCSVDSTSLSKCLPSPSSQLAQYITITQLCCCNQIIKLHIKHALELTKEGASDTGMQ